MSLQNIYSTVVAPYSTDIAGLGELYNYYPESTTYTERFNLLYSFYYASDDDSLNLLALMDQRRWPGWGVCWLQFDAATGEYTGRTALLGGTILTMAWSQWLGPGANNAFYRLTQGTLLECDRTSLVPTGGLSTEIDSWSPPPYLLANPCLVNELDGLAVMCHAGSFAIYDLGSDPPAIIGELPSPAYSFSGIGLEDRSRCWVVGQGGVILKANYALARWEVMSSVKDSLTDVVKYLITFDSTRKRPVVFVQRPDAEDGACRCRIEAYNPVYAAVGLTDPVPVEKVRAGQVIRFVSHLHGNAGEGISAYMANAALVEPAAGMVLTESNTIELNGVIKLRYQAPSEAGEDTLQVSVDT